MVKNVDTPIQRIKDNWLSKKKLYLFMFCSYVTNVVSSIHKRTTHTHREAARFQSGKSCSFVSGLEFVISVSNTNCVYCMLYWIISNRIRTHFHDHFFFFMPKMILPSTFEQLTHEILLHTHHTHTDMSAFLMSLNIICTIIKLDRDGYCNSFQTWNDQWKKLS